MYGVPPRGHLQGKIRDNSNTRFFHTKKEHTYMCSYIISVVYIPHIITCLKGFTLFYHTLFIIYFILSYSTHIWNAYVAGNLLEIKKQEK